FHFISSFEPGSGHLDGLVASDDSLFVADLSATGFLEGVGAGVIYQIKARSALTPVLAVTPASIVAGGTVTATWSGIAAPTPRDWIGLYVPGSGNNAYLAWIYVSCSQSRAAASAAGSCPFTIPSGLAPGSYELRLYPNEIGRASCRERAFTVTGSGGVTLSVSPTSLAAGGTVTATWSGIAAPTPGDWIGLYGPGSGDNAYLAWIYVSCSQSRAAASAAGSCPFTIPSGLAPGSYELRLYPN